MIYLVVVKATSMGILNINAVSKLVGKGVICFFHDVVLITLTSRENIGSEPKLLL